LKHWFSRLTANIGKSETKSSRVAPLIAMGSLGQPIWTPRRYDALAEEGYHQNVIVYRCIKLIAQGIASIPLLLYQNLSGHDHEVLEHPLLELLKRPSQHQAGSAWLESAIGYLLLAGNSYLEVVCHPVDQQPIEMYTLRPDRVKVIPGAHGSVIGYEYTVGSNRRVLRAPPESDRHPILHLKFFHPLNDWYGMSPLEAAAASIDQHNTVAAHNLALLQNGGRPSGAFILKPSSTMSGLTDTQRETLRQDLKRLYEGSSNAGRILMMEGDFSWHEMGLSPKDLDFIEGKHLSAREIAQAFGVPAMLVGIPGDATFSNYREARFHLWEDTILPLVEFLMAELNRWLAPYFGNDLRLTYDMDHIPALAPRREAYWSKIAQASFLTINEKRQAVGYTPIPDGNHLDHPSYAGGQ
jgi:HK97 family phage portal protein